MPPEDIPDDGRFAGIRLDAGAANVSLPDWQDELLDQLDLIAEQRRAYGEFWEEWREQMPSTFHRIGGYPEPIQGDPKLEAQLVSHGLYCGNPTGYERGKELGLWPGAAEWELLLQVDSDESAGMMWGDVGRLYFLIRKQDLESCRFESTWLVFQCY
jgi:uncharacterized protein YwqG